MHCFEQGAEFFQIHRTSVGGNRGCCEEGENFQGFNFSVSNCGYVSFFCGFTLFFLVAGNFGCET